MECGANEPVMDQSHMEMTMEAEVEGIATSVAYVDNEMSKKQNAWDLASGEVMPGKLQGYVEDDTEKVLEEPKSALEEVDAEAVEDADNWCVSSPSANFGAPGTDVFYADPDSEFIYIGITDSMSPLPQPVAPPTPEPAATPDVRHGSRLASITTSPFSPRPGTSRDSEHSTGLVDEYAFRSRSPLPGTSRDSLPWEPLENEVVDVVFEELDEAALAEDERWVGEVGGSLEEGDLAGMPVEMDVVDPTPLNESVAPQRSSQRGMRSRGVGTRGASSHRGRRAATYAVSDEIGWCRGEELIEVCVTETDVPPGLREVIDDVHDRNVRREQQMRRRVFRDDDSDSDCDPDSELGLFGGDSAALNFDWSPMETFQVSQERFLPEVTGPIRKFLDPYDAFRAYWDDDILQHLVVETNRYAAEIALRSAQFAKEWNDTNVDEIMILFAFWMMIGIHKMPTIQSCFSQHLFLKTDIFTHLFTKRRYLLLNRAFHFVDNSTRTPQSSRLFSLGPVLEHLKAAFMNAYTPGQDISIDESLTLWRGKKLVFKQYISTKAARFGIKTFELCEAATGYLWAFNVYTGKDTSVASSSCLPKSTTAVLDLVTPLLNKGHRLFMDNWFNSPILARYLKRNRTDCIGMIRKNRRNVPPLIQHATLPRGHFIARHAGDVVVMAYQDTKTVYTISTCHSVDTVQISARPGRPSHYKPAVINDYNQYMGVVDKKDQMLEPYLIERKRCMKWTRKLFKRLLNDSILNSLILLQSSGDQRPHLDFRIDLAEQIVKNHLGQVPKPRQRQYSNRNAYLPEERLIDVGRHFPVRLGNLNESLTGANRTSKNRGLCFWCRVQEKRYSKSVYKCEACDVFLCINACFKKYHTYCG